MDTMKKAHLVDGFRNKTPRRRIRGGESTAEQQVQTKNDLTRHGASGKMSLAPLWKGWLSATGESA